MIRHHPTETTLLAYAAGSLPEALAIVVATHIGGCGTCQGSLAMLEATAGVLLAAMPLAPLNDDALDCVLSRVDGSRPAPLPILNPGLPAPLNRIRLGRWWPIGPGIRWRPLHAAGPAWGGLILMQPGRALPRHRHIGRELTCVLSGSFADSVGQYEVGDLSEPEIDHGEPPFVTGAKNCLCITATEGLRFSGLLGLMQRVINHRFDSTLRL